MRSDKNWLEYLKLTINDRKIKMIKSKCKIDNQVSKTFQSLFLKDYSKHNSMVFANEEKRKNKEKVRNKVVVGFNVRITLADKRTNPEGFTFQEMYEDPDIHGEMLLRMSAWTRSKMKFDWEMGLPKKWEISPYAANVYEDSLLGAKVIFPGGYEVPATRPHFIGDDSFQQFMDYPFKSLPDQGHMRMIHETYLHWQDKCDKGWEYLGVPVKVKPCICGTDGPFTIACNVFGAQEICLMMLDDPERFHIIMNRIVELAVKRIKEMSELYHTPWIPENVKSFGFADDMIAIISNETYIEMVLPHHKKLIKELAPNASSLSIHLCGDSSRHFKTIKEELNVKSFDTGFPISFDNLRDCIGNDACVSGGPKCNLFLGSKNELVNETIRIAKSAVANLGSFTMREGNNLPPLVPDENLEAFYEAAVHAG